jgi:hypothetical protein
MSVKTRQGVLWAELSQARVGSADIPSARKADLAELSTPLGSSASSASDTLLSVGALAIGTREDVLKDTHNRRGYVCVTFPPEATLVAPTAYVISRIASIAHGLTV